LGNKSPESKGESQRMKRNRDVTDTSMLISLLVNLSTNYTVLTLIPHISFVTRSKNRASRLYRNQVLYLLQSGEGFDVTVLGTAESAAEQPVIGFGFGLAVPGGEFSSFPSPSGVSTRW
jgi:hypothetical protein